MCSGGWEPCLASRRMVPKRTYWRALGERLFNGGFVRWGVLALGCVGLGVIALSCRTIHRTVMAPPAIPNATFAGSESCAQCHEKITSDFHSATHARLKAEGPNAMNVGCESCHGPGSVHNQSGGARGTIVNPRKSPDACFQCHLEIEGRFRLPHHHPVQEGKVNCSDCHDPHKGDVIIGSGTSLSTQQDTCGKCHTAQRGPFVFEHEAVREGCTSCHQPHGSINAKMLVERNSVLCLKCHFQQQTAAGLFIGGRNHVGSMANGTCWTAGCHEAVHGSHTGSSLRF
jgi:predicted CXXCH cytochrome family protein